MMDLIGIEEVMHMTGRGRATVTRWLNEPDCPIFPRKKHEPYLIDRNDFLTWYSRKVTERKKVAK